MALRCSSNLHTNPHLQFKFSPWNTASKLPNTCHIGVTELFYMHVFIALIPKWDNPWHSTCGIKPNFWFVYSQYLMQFAICLNINVLLQRKRAATESEHSGAVYMCPNMWKFIPCGTHCGLYCMIQFEGVSSNWEQNAKHEIIFTFKLKLEL